MTYAGDSMGALVNGEGQSFRCRRNPSTNSVVYESVGGQPAKGRQRRSRGAGLVRRRPLTASMKQRGGRTPWRDMPRRCARAAIYLENFAFAEAGCPARRREGRAVHAATGGRPTHHSTCFIRRPEHEENRCRCTRGQFPIRRAAPHAHRAGRGFAISAHNVPFYTAFWKVVAGAMAGDSVCLAAEPATGRYSVVLPKRPRKRAFPEAAHGHPEGGARRRTADGPTDRESDLVQFNRPLHGRRQVARSRRRTPQAGCVLRRLAQVAAILPRAD